MPSGAKVCNSRVPVLLLGLLPSQHHVLAVLDIEKLVMLPPVAGMSLRDQVEIRIEPLEKMSGAGSGMNEVHRMMNKLHQLRTIENSRTSDFEKCCSSSKKYQRI